MPAMILDLPFSTAVDALALPLDVLNKADLSQAANWIGIVNRVRSTGYVIVSSITGYPQSVVDSCGQVFRLLRIA